MQIVFQKLEIPIKYLFPILIINLVCSIAGMFPLNSTRAISIIKDTQGTIVDDILFTNKKRMLAHVKKSLFGLHLCSIY